MFIPSEKELFNTIDFYRKKRNGFLIGFEINNLFFLLKTTDINLDIYYIIRLVYFESKKISRKFQNKQLKTVLQKTKYISLFNKYNDKIQNILDNVEEFYQFHHQLDTSLRQKTRYFKEKNGSSSNKDLNNIIKNTMATIIQKPNKLNITENINKDINLQNLKDCFSKEFSIKFHNIIYDFYLFDFIFNSDLYFHFTNDTYIFTLSNRSYKKIINECLFLYGTFFNTTNEEMFFIFDCLEKIKQIKTNSKKLL